MNRLSRLFLPALLLATLGWAYASTLAPDLTWANGGADGGDLIAATVTGGIPHPTGYPVYLLLGGLIQHLPIGPLAFRFNLLSVLSTLGAALLLYDLTRLLLPHPDSTLSRLAGFFAALNFGLAPLVWSQAVIAEVYGLHALFLVSILWLAARPASPRSDIFMGILSGLALGNHLTSIFLLPIVFLPVVKDPRSLGRRVSFFVLGLSPYLILPFRALNHPPVNWGNPVTVENFLWLVTGRLYQDELTAVTFSSLWQGLRSFARLALEQFGVVGLCLGLLGLVGKGSPIRMRWSLLWVAGISCSFFIAYVTRDSQVYLIPFALCFSVWIGLALGQAMNRWPRALPWLAAMVAVYLVVLAAQTWPRVDASQDSRAQEFGQSVLRQTPPDALLFAKGDEAVFALWYFHFALGQRGDVRVIASDLLHHAWYQQSLREAYPGLDVPGPFPFEETIRLANPTRPACYVNADEWQTLDCLDPARGSP